MEVILKVEGMSCGHCEKAVTDALTAIDGVNEVKVDLTSGDVEVDYNESFVTILQLTEAIEDQGYDVVKA